MWPFSQFLYLFAQIWRFVKFQYPTLQSISRQHIDLLIKSLLSVCPHSIQSLLCPQIVKNCLLALHLPFAYKNELSIHFLRMISHSICDHCNNIFSPEGVMEMYSMFLCQIFPESLPESQNRSSHQNILDYHQQLSVLWKWLPSSNSRYLPR